MSADMEMQMNAIERIEFYTNVETEEYDGKDKSWSNTWKFCIERMH